MPAKNTAALHNRNTVQPQPQPQPQLSIRIQNDFAPDACAWYCLSKANPIQQGERIMSAEPTQETTADQLADLELSLMTETASDQLHFRTLTLADRCDNDAAEAAVAQVIVHGQLMMFCGHHWRQHADVLADFPHSVPESEAKPMTWRRARELSTTTQ